MVLAENQFKNSSFGSCLIDPEHTLIRIKSLKSFSFSNSQASSPLIKRAKTFYESIRFPHFSEESTSFLEIYKEKLTSNSHPQIDESPITQIFTPENRHKPEKNSNFTPKDKEKIRRESRGEYQKQKVLKKTFEGRLTFYKLVRRFGFIQVEGMVKDIFVCEDDLVLSNINLRKFKDDVYHNREIRLAFNVKNYYDKNMHKKKAVNIKILN